MLLPSPGDITFITTRAHAKFTVPREFLYDPKKEPALQSIKMPTAQVGDKVPYMCEMAPYNGEESRYGSARYRFDPYEGVVSTPAVKESLRQNSLLQRWIKRQDKTIKKLVKTIKKLGKSSRRQEEEIRRLKEKLGETSGAQEEDQEEVQGEGIEEGEGDNEMSQSFRDPPREDVYAEPARSSSYETHQRRKRRASHSPVTVSSNMTYSSNLSYSMDKSSSYGN